MSRTMKLIRAIVLSELQAERISTIPELEWIRENVKRSLAKRYARLLERV